MALKVCFLHWVLAISAAYIMLDGIKRPLDLGKTSAFAKDGGIFSRVKGKVSAWTKSRKVDAEITAQWSYVLETLSIAVLSGMDLVSAFHAAVNGTTGLLRKEMEKVDARVQGGMPLRDALSIMELRKGSPVRRLETVLSQAQVLGIPVADVLENLAQEHQTYERQRFEERLNSLPVKLSVITVVFLLPPVIVVSVAPHIIRFMGAKW